MARLEDIVSFCDQRARTHQVADFREALNGLQFANNGRIAKIGAAVDAGLLPFQQAIDADIDFLIVHHGMFWNGAKRIVDSEYRKYKTLIEGNLAVYSCHLPLDAHTEIGNAACLARAIDALTTLEGTSLRQVEHAIAGTAPGVRAWRREANETFANMAESPLDLVAEALQGGIVIDWMAIHDGGGVATFEIVVAGDRPFAHRLGFMDAATQSHSGIMRLAQIDGAVIGALVGILRDDEQRAPAAPASLELH